MSRIAFAFFGFLFVLGRISAQESAQKLAEMPASGSWIIQIRGIGEHGSRTTQSEAAQGSPAIRTIQVTLSGDLRRDIIAWSNGKTSEFWKIRGYWVGDLPGAGVVVLSILKMPDGTAPTDPWKAFETSELLAYTTGVTPKETEVEGVPALLYEAKREQRFFALDPSEVVPPPVSYRTQLWVDANTRRPLALKDADTLYSFTFSDQPAGPLVAPAEARKEVDRFERRSRTPIPQHRKAPQF